MDPTIIGRSRSVETLKKQIGRLSKNSKDILIVGEPGIGKGVVAKRIHSDKHGDADERHPFMSINASVVDDKELEAVLFGFEKGVPGMPPTTKRGLFELADGGTVMIEEIEDASFRNQMKILDFLKERKTKRLGGDEGRSVDLRVVMTMKKAPELLLHEHKLYEELYEKLDQFEQIQILPLRERPEDIPMLVKHFVTEICQDLNIKDVAIDINAIDVLVRHTWKENIRELKAVVDKSILFS